MAVTDDRVALDDWYAVALDAAIAPGAPRRTRLLGEPIEVARDRAGALGVQTLGEDGAPGRSLPSERRHFHVWTTLGSPERDVFDIPEAREPGRRFVACGKLTVRASGLRVVENFLDMAHFPFVHTAILGSEPHTEVKPYHAEIRADVDEVWATECVFHQPRAALSAEGGVEAAYSYRVPSPYNCILFKTCPARENAFDLVGIFVQPRETTLVDVFPFYFLFDDTSTDAEIAAFQQMIFLQDKPILENQIPLELPLDAGAEIPTRADAVSIAYRRWLKGKRLCYGALTSA